MSNRPILYSFRRCPYAMRARMALIASGMVCHIREVKLSRKPQELVDASPKATVPVLVHTDGVIEQSLEIMRWALGRNDPEGWLERDDPALVETIDGPFKTHLDRYKYPDRHGSDPAAHRAAGVAILETLEARLASSVNLCGERRGLADVAIFPFVRQFAAVDPDWFEAQRLHRLDDWLRRHTASPLFERIMVRLKPWEPGDPPLEFAPA